MTLVELSPFEIRWYIADLITERIEYQKTIKRGRLTEKEKIDYENHIVKHTDLINRLETKLKEEGELKHDT